MYLSIVGFENWLLEDPIRLMTFRFNTMLVVVVLLTLACAYAFYRMNKQKTRIEELENLVEYYYNEDLIK